MVGNVGHDMTSPPSDSTHSRTTSGMACHHRLWEADTIERHRACHAIITFGLADTVERRRAWHAIIAFGLDDRVRRRRAWHAIIALRRLTRSNDIRRVMQTSPLGLTDGWTASGLACHHRLWEEHTVERRRAWHNIKALGQHTRWATSGVA